MATYEVDFSHNTIESPETFTYVIQWNVSDVPDYLTGSAITGHIQARLLHDNPTFKRIRHLTLRGEDVI